MAHPVVMSKFPSRWVEGHEITVDSCLEGETDVIAHTETFLVEYKQFHWDATAGEIKHSASGMCITPDPAGSEFTHLRNCSAASSKWTYDLTKKTFKTPAGGCLITYVRPYFCL